MSQVNPEWLGRGGFCSDQPAQACRHPGAEMGPGKQACDLTWCCLLDSAQRVEAFRKMCDGTVLGRAFIDQFEQPPQEQQIPAPLLGLQHRDRGDGGIPGQKSGQLAC